MYCNSCGSLLENNSNFCSECGKPINLINNKKNEKIEKASVIIGTISIILVFIFQILTMPLSLVGIILGFKSLSKNNKKTGLILNCISFVLAIPIFFLYFYILNPANNIIGTWNCKPFNNGYFEDMEYVLTLKLNRDNTFYWNVFGEEDTNYFKGNYEYKKLNKRVGNAEYYLIILNGTELSTDGIKTYDDRKSEYEIAVDVVTKKEALLMNAYSYNMYVCFKN